MSSLKGTASTALRLFRDEMSPYALTSLSAETCAIGTIHGNLRPESVLLDSAGMVWVLDFDTEKCNQEQHAIYDLVSMINYFLVDCVSVLSSKLSGGAANTM